MVCFDTVGVGNVVVGNICVKVCEADINLGLCLRGRCFIKLLLCYSVTESTSINNVRLKLTRIDQK